MSIETLASIIAPFVAVLGASAWLHGTLSELRTQIAALTERVRFLERELDRARNQQERNHA